MATSTEIEIGTHGLSDDAVVRHTYRRSQQQNSSATKRAIDLLESLVPQNVTHLDIHSSMYRIPTRRFRRYESLRCVSFLSLHEEDERETIPHSNVSLGREVFWGCRSLTHVKFPKDMELTEIPGHAFSYCFSLRRIQLPASTSSSFRVIGECAFLFCESLEEIQIPNSVVEIKRQAFFECRRLRIVKMPNRLELIGRESFAYCHSLQHMTLSSSVRTLGINVLQCCRSMLFLDMAVDSNSSSTGQNDRHNLALAIRLCVLYPKETEATISTNRLIHMYARKTVKPSELLTRSPQEIRKLKEIHLAYINAIRELVLWSVSIAGLFR